MALAMEAARLRQPLCSDDCGASFPSICSSHPSLQEAHLLWWMGPPGAMAGHGCSCFNLEVQAPTCHAGCNPCKLPKRCWVLACPIVSSRQPFVSSLCVLPATHCVLQATHCVLQATLCRALLPVRVAQCAMYTQASLVLAREQAGQ